MYYIVRRLCDVEYQVLTGGKCGGCCLFYVEHIPRIEHIRKYVEIGTFMGTKVIGIRTKLYEWLY